jgi:hypothetical protein
LDAPSGTKLAGAGPTSLDLMVFGPIRSVNIFEETLERVAYTIKSGNWPPGSR